MLVSILDLGHLFTVIGLFQHDGNAVLLGHPANQVALAVHDGAAKLMTVEKLGDRILHHHVRAERDGFGLHIILCLE